MLLGFGLRVGVGAGVDDAVEMGVVMEEGMEAFLGCDE